MPLVTGDAQAQRPAGARLDMAGRHHPRDEILAPRTDRLHLRPEQPPPAVQPMASATRPKASCHGRSRRSARSSSDIRTPPAPRPGIVEWASRPGHVRLPEAVQREPEGAPALLSLKSRGAVHPSPWQKRGRGEGSRDEAIDLFRQQLDAIRAAGTYKEERVIASPQGAAIRRGRARASSTSARTTTSASPSHPAVLDGGARGARRARLRPLVACASSAARRTCTSELESALRPLLRHRDTILYSLLLRRQRRRSSRRCSARRTRSSPTRSTTRRSSTASGSARRERLRYANGDMAELEARAEGDAGQARCG